MSAAVDRHSMTFAGIPGSSWAFAIRIWLAISLALYAGFWLELESASTAATTVAILSLPTRGQVLGKAIFLLIGTALGVTVSISLVGLFAQTEVLLLGAFAVWFGLCVYVVGLWDGYRAYAAALSGFTVAIVAVQQIDNPQHIFESGMARGAAITIGVISVAIVNDLLAVPDQHPNLAAKLASLRQRATNYARCVLGGETVPATSTAALLGEVVSLRPEINNLATELDSGPARSAAARSAMVAVVAELFAIRALEMLSAFVPSTLRERIIAGLEDDLSGNDIKPHEAVLSGHNGDLSAPMASTLFWSAEYLLRSDHAVKASLAALAGGWNPPQVWRAPLHTSHRIAAAGGIRATTCFLLAAAVLAPSGWASIDLSLMYVAMIIGFGALNPDPRTYTTVLIVAAPIASLMAGIIEFVVLDGATAFPLLAITLAPFTIGLSLLIPSQNQQVSTISRSILIYMLIVLAPSNPSTYNPQSFLLSALFFLIASGLMVVIDILVPPASGERRLRRLLASVRLDLAYLPSRRAAHFTPEEAMFRDASRIAQMISIAGDAETHQALLEEAMASFDQAGALRFCEVELNRLTPGPLGIEVDAAYAALIKRDPDAILACSNALREAASPQQISVNGAGEALVLASAAFATRRCSVEPAS